VEVWQTSSLQQLRLGEENKKERRKKPKDENIMSASAMQSGHKQNKYDKYSN